jgi:hypothetical protein
MKQSLIDKMNEMPIVRRKVLFAGVELFCNTVHLDRHKNALIYEELRDYCILSTDELSHRYNVTHHELSDLYKFTKDHKDICYNTEKVFSGIYLNDKEV